MTTIKEQIITNFVAALDTISIANGYINDFAIATQKFDINNAQWKTPCNILSTGSETYEDFSYGVVRCNMTVMVDTYFVHTRKSGDPYENVSTDTALNNLVSDIIKAALTDRQRNSLAKDTVVQQSDRYVLVAEGVEYMLASTQFAIAYDINEINPESTV